MSRPSLWTTNSLIQKVEGSLLPSVNPTKPEAGHLPTYNAEVEGAWGFASVPLCAFIMRGLAHGQILRLIYIHTGGRKDMLIFIQNALYFKYLHLHRVSVGCDDVPETLYCCVLKELPYVVTNTACIFCMGRFLLTSS